MLMKLLKPNQPLRRFKTDSGQTEAAAKEPHGSICRVRFKDR